MVYSEVSCTRSHMVVHITWKHFVDIGAYIYVTPRSHGQSIIACWSNLLIKANAGGARSEVYLHLAKPAAITLYLCGSALVQVGVLWFSASTNSILPFSHISITTCTNVGNLHKVKLKAFKLKEKRVYFSPPFTILRLSIVLNTCNCSDGWWMHFNKYSFNYCLSCGSIYALSINFQCL